LEFERTVGDGVGRRRDRNRLDQVTAGADIRVRRDRESGVDGRLETSVAAVEQVDPVEVGVLRNAAGLELKHNKAGVSLTTPRLPGQPLSSLPATLRMLGLSTGKGLSSAAAAASERGVLRRQVPLWLSLPEFRRFIVSFEQAHVSHGGEGALYLRLRRRER
jgi:hypothetical protein